MKRQSARRREDATGGPGRERPITALDVARLAGVSRSAVSRALTPGSSISEKMRQKVMGAVAQLGYRPNVMARSLMTQRSGLIAVVMAHLRNPFFTDMLGLFNRKFRAGGYQTLLLALDADRSADEVMDSIFEYQPDGAVLVACSLSDTMIARCREYRVPVVIIDRGFPETADDFATQVWIDSARLATEVAERLLAEGRRRIALVEGIAGEPLSARARRFMERMLREEGVSVLLDHGQYSYEGGYAAGLRLLNSPTPPDGIFCVSDPMALGVLDAARYELKLDLPRELSIIGFSDIPAAGWRSHALTTARLPIADLVEAASGVLLERVVDPALRPEHVLLECPLILRDTTLRADS